VMLADNRKVNGLTAVSTEKDRNNNGHYMLEIDIRQKMMKF
jgi:hypothetical protein